MLQSNKLTTRYLAAWIFLYSVNYYKRENTDIAWMVDCHF